MKESILKSKSYRFALNIVWAVKELQNNKKEFILSKQLMRSGTAIGALIREAEFAQSKADFIHKYSVSLKEANETKYWLCLIQDSDYMDKMAVESLLSGCNELLSLLVASIKTLKGTKN